ncbi:hypothetical protein [Nocardia niigatensis]
MSDGTDGQDIDPEKTTSSGDWWREGPLPERPRPSPPQLPYPHPGPNPYVSRPNPSPGPGVVPGPGPRTGPSPYQSGPNPYQSSPYHSGPNPLPPKTNSYSAGPSPFPAAPPGGFAPPPDGNRGRVWLLAGAGALVVAIAAIVAIVIVMRDSGTGAAPATTAKPTSSTGPAGSTARTTTTAPASTLTPQIPGYQVVVPTDMKAAWDIPKDWTIDQTTTKYGTDSDSIPAAGFSEEGVDYCPDNVRTNMFLTNSSISDATAAATDVGAHAARLGWSTRTSLNAGAGQPLATTDGTLHGTFLETSGAFTAPAGCATTYSVYTFALSVGDGKGSLVLAIVADTGVDRSVTADFARKLFATFRLL